MRVYLDVCCLNRPFDDQKQDKIRFETEAILLILEKFQMKDWKFIVSSAVIMEVSRTTDVERRINLEGLLREASETITISESVVARTKLLMQENIKRFDALHLALAEEANVDVFLSTDKKLVNKCRNIELNVKVENPCIWLIEMGDEDDNE